MILVEVGTDDQRSFDAKVRFARQLTDCGHQVIIDEDNLPDEMNGALKYESIHFLSCVVDAAVSRVLIIGAETVSDAMLARIRGYRFSKDVRVSAIGRFENPQAFIAAQSKIAYALGYEPEMLDLSVLQPKPLLQKTVAPLFASVNAGISTASESVQLMLVMPKDELEDETILPLLAMLDHVPGIMCNIVTAGSGRHQIRKSGNAVTPVLGFSELSPATISKSADVVVYFGRNIPGERMAALALDVMAKAGVVIDCTVAGALVASGAPVVRGPVDIHSLAPFLQGTVLPNLRSLGDEAAAHPWVSANSIESIQDALGLPAKTLSVSGKVRKPRTVFFPTNGVGLGHAQRCLQIATAMEDKENIVFSAFPSCLPMLQTRGFDCLPMVSKSEFHSDQYANDLLNYVRLGQVLGAGDRFVFDGGYVFDSVYRSILEKQLSAVWIRRGLWRPGQATLTPIERQKVFDCVIVPDEPLEELNLSSALEGPVQRVGPILQYQPLGKDQRSNIRGRLKKTVWQWLQETCDFNAGGRCCRRPHGAIAITLCPVEQQRRLFASDRCLAKCKGFSGHFRLAKHPGCQNHNAAVLCQAADLVVSATGYNSFNEILYHKIPAIFIPQIASYMDDQEKRATAAAERGVAVAVMPEQLLELQKQVTALLDGGKADELRANLAELVLPEKGMLAAAKLIQGGVDV